MVVLLLPLILVKGIVVLAVSDASRKVALLAGSGYCLHVGTVHFSRRSHAISMIGMHSYRSNWKMSLGKVSFGDYSTLGFNSGGQQMGRSLFLETRSQVWLLSPSLLSIMNPGPARAGA